MKMFLGEYKPNITNGSRITLPKKLREQISSTNIILSKGFEKCIFLYDKSDWIVESQKHIEKPITDVKSRDLKRYLYSSASETSIDKQGRFVIPQNLQSYAEILEEVMVIGAGDHIEIWDYNTWESYLNKINKEVNYE